MLNLLLLLFIIVLQPLEETFTSSTLSFNYPSNWVTQDLDIAVNLATSEASLETGSPLDDGEMRATIIISWMQDIPLENRNAPLIDIINELQAINEIPTCDPFEPLQLALIQTSAIYYARQSCETTDNLLIVKRFDHDALGIIVASSEAGKMNTFEPVLLQVGASLRHLANAYTIDTASYADEYTTESFSFRLPEAWRMEENESLIGVTDGETSLFESETAQPDGTFSLITVYSPDDLPDDVDASAIDVLRWLTEEGQSGFEYTAPLPISINGREAARSDLNTGVVDLTYLVIALGNDYFATMNVFALPGEFANDTSVIYGILSTVQVIMEQ